jgi:hypothetical protein
MGSCHLHAATATNLVTAVRYSHKKVSKFAQEVNVISNLWVYHATIAKQASLL